MLSSPVDKAFSAIVTKIVTRMDFWTIRWAPLRQPCMLDCDGPSHESQAALQKSITKPSMGLRQSHRGDRYHWALVPTKPGSKMTLP